LCCSRSASLCARGNVGTTRRRRRRPGRAAGPVSVRAPVSRSPCASSLASCSCREATAAAGECRTIVVWAHDGRRRTGPGPAAVMGAAAVTFRCWTAHATRPPGRHRCSPRGLWAGRPRARARQP
jgi:hypothetical protein